MDFIKQEMLDAGVPIILVGHSIGSHISLRMLEKSPEKVLYCIGLYPFLKVNSDSFQQSIIRNLCRSSFTCAAVSLIVSSFGFLPRSASKFIISKSLGKSWSTTAIEAACSHLLNYHTVRNMLFMAMTEFEKLSEEPDWAFWEMNKRKLAFLFGTDDHWGPLQMLEEISCQVPEISLSIEREGHTHAFSCTQAGSTWVAEYVASSIKDHLSSDTFSGPRKAL
ncbi:hypothetical protein SAY86_014611 [Trapa natans]|uniref:Lipid droplet-associated hydrolase n=1 Tax=Trapa natans TaxID=22666 RepID=A0AAN7KHB5_TRANT|nr:hypothetical protein SAY86_014611 [Trapa natans]